tara:strand:+ start:504 stop:746 length:243 start_codon:yes stop_codon:yes gene_type:complete
MDKHTRKELTNLVDKYNLTVFQRARILYRAKVDFNYYNPLWIQDLKEYNDLPLIKTIKSDKNLKGFFNQVEKDCLEVKND